MSASADVRIRLSVGQLLVAACSGLISGCDDHLRAVEALGLKTTDAVRTVLQTASSIGVTA